MKKVVRRLFNFSFILFAVTILTNFAIHLFSIPHTEDPLLLEAEVMIETYLFRLTPIGTSMDDVLAEIGRHKEWSNIRIIDNHGYVIQGRRYSSDLLSSGVVGEKSILVTLGTYQEFYEIYVAAYWGFDKDSKLINIYVIKEETRL
jgi:hypothetical protein